MIVSFMVDNSAFKGPESIYNMSTWPSSLIFRVYPLITAPISSNHIFSTRVWYRRALNWGDCANTCNQSFNLEPGFYYGSSYVSYALTVALSAATFAFFWIFIGFPFSGNFIIYWLISNAILLFSLQPYLMRVSRTVWLAFFVRYDPGWAVNPPAAPERVNKEQENNW